VPHLSPYLIELTSVERRELTRHAAQYTAPYRALVRARVVLMAADGLQNKDIAARFSLPVQSVTQWRKRFYTRRLPGLEEGTRIGRPNTTPANNGTASN